MPEYNIPTESAGPEWHALDDFTKGFIEAAFFCDTSCYDASEFFDEEAQEEVREGLADGSIPSDAGPEDIEPESLARVAKLCREFQATHAALLAEAYNCDDYSEVQAGRDFYFTRAGHGVGYWDREQLKADGLDKRLSDAAGSHEINLDAHQDDKAPSGFYVTFYC